MRRQPTTQQITWFLDLYRNNQLDLEPPYQRKSVWSSKDRKFFLDTIFRNYPAPPIFIHRTVNDQGYTKYLRDVQKPGGISIRLVWGRDFRM